LELRRKDVVAIAEWPVGDLELSIEHRVVRLDRLERDDDVVRHCFTVVHHHDARIADACRPQHG